MTRAWAVLLAAVTLLGAAVAPAAAIGNAPAGSIGIDVSYPQCGAEAAFPAAAFAVVGVTKGAPYTGNPCLAAEAARVTTSGLYVNTGWNAASPHVSSTTPHRCAKADSACRAYNYGYNAGRAAFAYAAGAGVGARTWWLDVEAGNTWSSSAAQNRASIQGERDALRAKGVAVIGVYSTTAQWNGLTGRWVNGWPGWGATVLTSAAKARTYCTGHRFTGGPTWMIQFRSGGFDRDVACAVPVAPSAPRALAVRFPRAGSASATWSTPASRGSSAISAYRVRWSADGGRTWTGWTSVGLHRLAARRGLVRGHAYRFQVRAMSAAGPGVIATRAFAQGR